MKSTAKNLRDTNYYGLAHEGSTDLTHPSMKILLGLFSKSEKILDMGCGEGTRLNTLNQKAKSKNKKELVGADISRVAIKIAKQKYPNIKFLVADLENLPFKGEGFNLLYSAYVFEHLTNPEKVLGESLRVLKRGGKFMIIAPNFGSPNRRSPNSKENKIKKLLKGLIDDCTILERKSLNWKSVVPLKNVYTIDSDTTVEPYLLSLAIYCQDLGFTVEYYSSNWKVDNFSPFQILFRLLGNLNIYPFKYWGPHLSIVLKK